MNKVNNSYTDIISRNIFIQTMFCILIIGAMFFVSKDQYFQQYIAKYNWIVKSNMSYNNMYNSCISFVNEKFNFNIPVDAEFVNLQEEQEKKK